MRQQTRASKEPAEKVVQDIRRATRKHYSAEEKIRIVLEGLRGEDSIAELCRREGIAQNLYYRWSKDFLEAGKKRLAGDTARAAKSGSFGGRPQIDADLHVLIRRMSADNPLWGAPRIHGELLKLGCVVAQSSVAKYMVKRSGPPSQGWRTFLRNHAPDIAAMDLFVVPTIGFDLLYVLVIIRLERRNLVWINVTPNPSAEWVARQITEAFPWTEAPRYLVRDRDRVYGAAVMHRLRAMGIRDKPIAPGSPWQNGFAERLIGSIRRECVDHVVVLGEAHRYRQCAGRPAAASTVRMHG